MKTQATITAVIILQLFHDATAAAVSYRWRDVACGISKQGIFGRS